MVSVISIIDSNLQGKMEQHYTNLNKKLDKLNNSHPQRTWQATRGRMRAFYPSTINLTDIKFTKEEQELLDKGLQYNIQQTSKTNWTNLVVETEQAIETRNQDAYRILAAKKLKQLQHSLNNDNTMHKRHIYLTKNIQHKIKVNNAMITQADKGRTLVIIYREDYHNKVHTFLTNNNFQTIPKNPTNMHHKQITQNIKQCNLVFHKEQYKYLTLRNPNPPTLKAQIKLHKDGNPIRPVINNIHTPSYKAAKKLNRILQQRLNLGNQYTEVNSVTLAQDLMKININNKTHTNNNGHKRPIHEHTYHRNHRHNHYATITA